MWTFLFHVFGRCPLLALLDAFAAELQPEVLTEITFTLGNPVKIDTPCFALDGITLNKDTWFPDTKSFPEFSCGLCRMSDGDNLHSILLLSSIIITG
jgi:hypothetical protein